MKKPRRILKWTLTRRIVQWGIILLFLSPLFFVDVESDHFFFGSLASSSIFGITLTDPFAALQVLFATRELNVAYLGGALIIFVFYLLIRGRSFCSWVCPVNTLLELTNTVREKFSLPDRQYNRQSKKYYALAMIVLSFILGVPLFELFSPIGFTMKNMLFTYGVGIWILLAIVLFEFFISKRGWCRYICPLGGFYQSFGRIGLFRVKFNHDACVGCTVCRSVCFADPDILEPAINREYRYVTAGDCSLCGACVDHCPFDALSITLRELSPLEPNSFHQHDAHKAK